MSLTEDQIRQAVVKRTAEGASPTEIFHELCEQEGCPIPYDERQRALRKAVLWAAHEAKAAAGNPPVVYMPCRCAEEKN